MGSNRGVTPTVYVSVDVEADGPIPGPYSMVSFGAAVAGWHDADGFRRAGGQAASFYRELRPISADYNPEALAVSGLDRAALEAGGAQPAAAMREFAQWVERLRTGPGGRRYRPVMVAYPAVYDWQFVYWYLIRFTGSSPFGHSGCMDLKTLYAARAGVPFAGVGKRSMPPELLPDLPHTHHALDDAREQAVLFANLLEWPGVDAAERA
ncbi:exonuclease [Streptomyces kaniharaensis]|uniref:Exonuclease n=1 Tax=Streptomyces kaniharaensis TaxID=212423 RepID=A0A6N7KPB8_9ACTN|nr:exonuclease [Streptomyces kaniharaensis]MQS11954.1 exonuclease [Streptomyces kaniharaensis]